MCREGRQGEYNFEKNTIRNSFKPLLENSLKSNNDMLLPETNIQPDIEHNNTGICNEAFHPSRDLKFPEKEILGAIIRSLSMASLWR